MIVPRPVLERWLLDGVVIIDPIDQPGLLRLEATAATLWAAVSGSPDGLDDDELITMLATEYAVTPETIRADVDAAVDQLVEHGAVRRA